MIRRLVLVSIALCLAACDRGAPVVASDVEVTSARPGVPMRAAYMRIENRSSDAIRITSATSPQFGRVELHESILEDGVARMRPVRELTIEPRSDVRLERGGLHLMLMRPVESTAGDDITLNLYDGDRLLITVSASGATD